MRRKTSLGIQVPLFYMPCWGGGGADALEDGRKTAPWLIPFYIRYYVLIKQNIVRLFSLSLSCVYLPVFYHRVGGTIKRICRRCGPTFLYEYGGLRDSHKLYSKVKRRAENHRRRIVRLADEGGGLVPLKREDKLSIPYLQYIYVWKYDLAIIK